ncbi:MAG TPA: SRPBCC domain-containing protein [Candidatus Dormibacteraeota bacterium]
MAEARPKLTIERTFDAPIEEVWDLWTTRSGVESWWGPEGFAVTVEELDLKPGGQIVYSMSAVGTDQIEYMTKAGMPITTLHRSTYTEVDPPRRLGWKLPIDFVVGVETYEVDVVIELSEDGDATHMVLTADAMHDDEWTKRAQLGRESELEKLERVLAERKRERAK